MNLALAILFLWLGCALMYVAFHPLKVESSKGGVADIFKSLQTTIQEQAPDSDEKKEKG